MDSRVLGITKRKVTRTTLDSRYKSTKANPFVCGYWAAVVLFQTNRQANILKLCLKSLYYILIRPFGSLSHFLTRYDYLKGTYEKWFYENEIPNCKYHNIDLSYKTFYRLFGIPVWGKTKTFDNALDEFLISE